MRFRAAAVNLRFATLPVFKNRPAMQGSGGEGGIRQSTSQGFDDKVVTILDLPLCVSLWDSKAGEVSNRDVQVVRHNDSQRLYHGRLLNSPLVIVKC